MKRRTPLRSFTVRDLSQVRALAHPLRLRLLEAFGEAPRTTKQVATLLGEKPTRLYHHVEALAKAGLVRLKETRPNRGTIEKYYEAVAQRLEVDCALFSSAPAAAATAEAGAAAMARALLDTTQAELLAHIRRGRRSAKGMEPIVGRMMVVGSRADLRTLRARISALIERCKPLVAAAKRRRKTDKAGRERWALTLAFYPLAADDGPDSGGTDA